MNELSKIIDAFEPASSIGDELLSSLARRGDARRYDVGDLLIREGERSASLFILVEGRVRVFGSSGDGREVMYNLMGRGEFFGEMCLDGGTRSASVAAIEPTTCIVVTGEQLEDFVVSHPEFAMILVKKLICRVRHATQQIKSLALEDVYQRTTRLLQSLLVEEDGRWLIADSITPRDIANRVGASQEMINRILRQLIHGGHLGTDDNARLVVLKPLPVDD